MDLRGRALTARAPRCGASLPLCRRASATRRHRAHGIPTFAV
ncbi:hypothetical protein BSLA_01r1499 [Burkholderia stabilis]|nr:hypothetical protein BSLA_01r1499 [Burkholderia stabilis]